MNLPVGEIELKIISGRANPEFSERVAQALGVKLTEVTITNFADSETYVKIEESVRGADVFIIQPTVRPVNESLMELLILLDAARRASAGRVTAVVPYYGYGRQDRKTRGREPISAKLVANLITTAGADRVLTIDLHAGQIQGFFDIPLDNLTAINIFAEYFSHIIKNPKEFVVLSPDVGGVPRARKLANLLGVALALVDKRRPKPNEVEVVRIIGDVSGKNIIIVDDIVDTAGSLVEAAKALKEAGAKEIFAAATHPVLSPPAVERIGEAPLRELVVTDTIPLRDDVKRCNKIKVVSVAWLFAEAIRRIHLNKSVSSLFR